MNYHEQNTIEENVTEMLVDTLNVSGFKLFA